MRGLENAADFHVRLRGLSVFLLTTTFISSIAVAGSGGVWREEAIAPQDATISGVVVDASGRAVRRATVLVRNAHVPAAYSSRTDDAGRFSVAAGGRAGLHEMVAYAAGYGIGVKRYRLVQGESLQHLLFQLEASAELRGTVLDRFYAPVIDARIEVQYERPLARLTRLQLGTGGIRTGSDGTFRLRNLQPRVPFAIVARHQATGRDNEENPFVDFLAPGQQRDGVVIVVTEGGS